MTFECDESGMCPIVGPRYHQKEKDYDLCKEEFNKLSEKDKSGFEVIAERDSTPVPYTDTTAQDVEVPDQVGDGAMSTVSALAAQLASIEKELKRLQKNGSLGFGFDDGDDDDGGTLRSRGKAVAAAVDPAGDGGRKPADATSANEYAGIVVDVGFDSNDEDQTLNFSHLFASE